MCSFPHHIVSMGRMATMGLCCVVRKEWANMVYKTKGLQANSEMVLKEVLLADEMYFLKVNPWETGLHPYQW